MSATLQSSSPAKPPRVRFSPRRVWTLAAATVTQLVRMKILAFLAVFCLLAVGAGFAFSVINPEQQLTLLKRTMLGSLQIFSLIIGVVSTALLLPKDMEDRTLYTILSKPVPRFDYLLGKLLGVLLLIGGGLVVMDAVLSLILWLRQSIVADDIIARLQMERTATPETMAQVREIVARQGLTWNLHWAVWAVFLKAAVVTTVALLLSTVASSTLFTIVMTACITIIGHGESLIREFFFQPHLSSTASRLAALVLAALVPDLAQFDIVDSVVLGEVVSWAAVLDITGIAALYLTVYLFVAHLLFAEKEL